MPKRKKQSEKSSSRKMNNKRIRRRKKWISLESNFRRNRNTNQTVCQKLLAKIKARKRGEKFQNSKGKNKNLKTMH